MTAGLVAETQIKGVPVPPDLRPIPPPDPPILIDDDLADAEDETGSEEVETPISEADELPVDVDVVRLVSLRLNDDNEKEQDNCV